MPTTSWNVTNIDGQEYLVIDSAEFRVPSDFDPSSNTFIAVVAPPGGVGNFPTLVPALVQGDIPIATPVHDCSFHEYPQLWVTPEFIEQTDGWSWWSSPLEVFKGPGVWDGQFFVYEIEGIQKMWQIVKYDSQRGMALGKWPD